MYDISNLTSELEKMKEDKLAQPLNANDMIQFTEEELKAFENMVILR